MNLGIDYGMTNTLAATVDKKELRLCPISEGPIPSIPTIAASSSDGKMSFGYKAKLLAKKIGTKMLKGLKSRMYNPEDDSAIGIPREENSTAVTGFLSTILNTVKRVEGESIEKVCIGVPEVWLSTKEGYNARTELKKALEPLFEQSEDNKLELISEAIAVSSYYAYLSDKKEDNLLIVDAGGSTIDIALVRYSKVSTEEDELGLDIELIKRSGSDVAGVKYIEEVVRLVCGIDEVDYNIYSEMEENIIASTEEIAFFNSVGNNENDVVFTFTMDDHREIPVTMSILKKAFDSVIKPKLDDAINEVLIGEKNATFEFAPAGGFSEFPILRSYLERKVNSTANVLCSPKNARPAVAYGLALIADGKVRIETKAPYTLGFVGLLGDDAVCTCICVYKNESIRAGTLYYACLPVNEVGRQKVPAIFTGSKISNFYLAFDTDAPVKGIAPKGNYEEKLRLCGKHPFRLAVSFDQSSSIILHVENIDYLSNHIISTNDIYIDDIYDVLGYNMHLLNATDYKC